MTDQSQTSGQNPEAQAPTPTPASGTDAGEFTAGTAEPSGNETEGTAQTPEQAESPEDADADEIPSTEQLEEPSTEKDPAEEPKAPRRDDPEPDHHAVGIGVIDAPDTDPAA
jgi:hypothetical protein